MAQGTDIFTLRGKNLRKFTSDERKTSVMAGGSMEKKSPSQVLWPLRKLGHVLGARDARARGMDFIGGEIVD